MSTKAWKEERRKRAWELYQSGWKQKDIAEALGVTKGAVSQWITSAKKAGVETLQARKKPGAPKRLSTEERQRIPELLARGAESYGFHGDVWTCPRVSKVIKKEFGISYHPAHVSRILKELGWTPQKPIRRAKQRAANEIRRWKDERWLELKKGQKRRTNHCFHR